MGKGDKEMRMWRSLENGMVWLEGLTVKESPKEYIDLKCVLF